MELSQNSKTEVISYIIDISVLKLWKISKKMRCLIQNVLKDKQIYLFTYDKRALVLNEWVNLGKHSTDLPWRNQMMEGVSNYELHQKPDLDDLLETSGYLRCWTIHFKSRSKVFFDYVGYLSIDRENQKMFETHFFDKIRQLDIKDLNSGEIEEILKKVETIQILTINDAKLDKLDLSTKNIQKLKFDSVEFTEKVDLPDKIGGLSLNTCSNIHFIDCKKLEKLKISTQIELLEEELEWIKSLKGLKHAKIPFSFKDCMQYLPSTTRKIRYSPITRFKNIEIAQIKAKFPYLIQIYELVPFKVAKELNLRSLLTDFDGNEAISSYRPRRIIIGNNEIDELHKHPEILEKVSHIVLYTNLFNFDWLQTKIGYACFCSEINAES